MTPPEIHVTVKRSLELEGLFDAVWLPRYLFILQYLVIHPVLHMSMYVIAPPIVFLTSILMFQKVYRRLRIKPEVLCKNLIYYETDCFTLKLNP